jgi:hypothetical protein
VNEAYENENTSLARPVHVQFPFAQVACNCEQIVVNGCPLRLQLAVQNANTARLFFGPKSGRLLGRQSANQLVNGIHNYVCIHGHRDGRECLAKLLILKGGKIKLFGKYISQLALDSNKLNNLARWVPKSFSIDNGMWHYGIGN